VSDRAARGMSYQGLTKEWGVSPCLVALKGTDLLGLPLKAPMSVYEKVYTLPLLTISMGKGTGVVTSVPSDAPDDYVALKELVDKPLWREKFGITAEMVEPYPVVPIIGKQATLYVYVYVYVFFLISTISYLFIFSFSSANHI